jgi:hypothetical protein
MRQQLQKEWQFARGARSIAIAAAVALLAAAGCSRGGPAADVASPSEPIPVSGRVDTKAGVSLDFPSGWAQGSLEGKTYTRFYENAEQQLSLGVSDFQNNGSSIWTLGEQVKRRLTNNGTLVESGPVTVDGHEAYRAVAQIRTDSGHGLIIGLVLLRPPDRASTVFVFSTRDERPGNREQMESLLSTLRVV